MNTRTQERGTGDGFNPARDLDEAAGSVSRYGVILHFLAAAAGIYLSQIVAAKKPLGSPLDQLVMLASNHVACEPATLNGLTVSYDPGTDEVTVSAPEGAELPSGGKSKVKKLPAYRPRP